MNKRKKFNVTGLCIPELHYMVDISEKINLIIKDYINNDAYFTINRARQFGKTTTLRLLEHALKNNAIVIRISFEGKEEYFASFRVLAGGLCFSFYKALKPEWPNLADIFKPVVNPDYPMQDLNGRISEFCEKAQKRTVLMIDEVDKAADNQPFLSFLGVLRDMYLERMDNGTPAFSNVILAGVHDIKNLKVKMRPDEAHSYNSPWNVAEDFTVDMSFSSENISRMLEDYEHDHNTGMNILAMAEGIYGYTSGYPYLVSRICKIIDEQLQEKAEFSALKTAWTAEGLTEAVKMLLKETNTLFDDMNKKISDTPELKNMLYLILFNGQSVPYNPNNFAINLGVMFGFIKESHGFVAVSNRIFETWMYNLFMSEEILENKTYKAASRSKSQFIVNGQLDMDLVMYKFMEHFTDIYGDKTQSFKEEDGRRLFLLYLKPIINGTGNFYIEAQTRHQTRTDVIVDYLGNQYVIEMKLWHGNEYNQRGEKQLSEYLEYYHLKKGYMLSFNFSKNKKTGVKLIDIGDKQIFEVVV